MRNDWTIKQESIIREHAHEGVGAVRDAIERECGVTRTVRAIEAHASRIRVSLKVQRACPECGAIGVHINRQSGMCRRCTELGHAAEEEAYNKLLRLEAAGCDEGPEIEEARKRYARLRQANSRLSRQHGLASKRERDERATL